MKLLAILAVVSAVSTPAATPSPLEQGFAGALRGCEEWVLNPASWIDGTEPFLKTLGLGESLAQVKSIPEIALPPQQMRRANHYWRITSTLQSGYFLVVSDQMPMCHITGGGAEDFQPAIASVLASPQFSGRWELVEDQVNEDLVSSRYRLRSEPKFEIIISRAKLPAQRTDRVQVLATAVMDLGK